MNSTTTTTTTSGGGIVAREVEGDGARAVARAMHLLGVQHERELVFERHEAPLAASGLVAWEVVLHRKGKNKN